MPDSTPPDARPKSRLVRWFLGDRGAHWGTDPGQYNAGAVKETLSSMGRLFGPGRYFGLEIQGWENVPQAPGMFISNHSGGTTIPDVWGLLIGWYRHFGTDRPIHPMAHEIILGTQVTAKYFSQRGILRANPGVAACALTQHRHDVLVMPGGDLDTWRPYSERYSVRFGGRRGYARLALRTGVPIIPVANAGAHETLLVLTDGRKLARALGLYDMARAEIFPVHLSLPWLIGIGPLPHLPTPVTLRYKIGKPVEVPAGAVPGEEPTDEQVHEYDARVQKAVQSLLDQLRAEDERARARKKASERLTSIARTSNGFDLSALPQAILSELRSSIAARL